jgi:hypothetical protein
LLTFGPAALMGCHTGLQRRPASSAYVARAADDGTA